MVKIRLIMINNVNTFAIYKSLLQSAIKILHTGDLPKQN